MMSSSSPLREVPNRFPMRRALVCALASLLPIPHRLLGEACLGIVVRQQFGLSRDRLGEPLGEDLRNALMVLLPRASQQ